MAFKGSGWRKLAQFMPYHLLSDINRNVLFSIVNRNSMPDHVRYNHTGTRPSFQYFLFTFLFISSIRERNFKSTYGPFFDDRTKRNSSSHYYLLFTIHLSVFYSCSFIPFRILSKALLVAAHNELYFLHLRGDGQSGFIALPRTVGRITIQRFRPAFPTVMFS